MRIRVDENDCFGFINYWTRTCTTAHVSRLLSVSSVQHLHWSHLTSPCWQTDSFLLLLLFFGGRTDPPPPFFVVPPTSFSLGELSTPHAWKQVFHLFIQVDTRSRKQTHFVRLTHRTLDLFLLVSHFKLFNLMITSITCIGSKSHGYLYLPCAHIHTHKQTYLIASLQT